MLTDFNYCDLLSGNEPLRLDKPVAVYIYIYFGASLFFIQLMLFFFTCLNKNFCDYKQDNHQQKRPDDSEFFFNPIIQKI